MIIPGPDTDWIIYVDAAEVIYMRDLLTMRDQVISAIWCSLEVYSL